MPRVTSKPGAVMAACVSAPMRRQAGAASLIVVMVLFFLMSLVAAYTSRNLIFEQRTSVNQYRATQAYEAAEAGLEWALTMLNSGRIGADCLETGATTANTSFRQRYLAIDADTGVVTPRVGPTSGTPLWPSCVSDGAGGWACNCPSDATPSLSAPSGSGVFPAFRVRFTANDLSRPGLIRIESNGCTKLDDACLNHPASAQNFEGRANVAAIVALASALPTPPGAALTVLRDVPAGSILALYNTDADLGGITVQAGGTVDYAAWTLRSVPGTPGPASVAQGEVSLNALTGAPDRAFASVFSMWPATYRTQPAAVVVDCPTADCRPNLATAVAMNPDRVIWATTADPTGTITLASAGAVGSAPGASVAGPAVIVFDRPVNVTIAGVSIFGFVHSRSGNWQGTNPVEVQGAAFIEGDLANTARATVVMNSAVLKSLRLRSGSFVRAPGGWDDFRGRAP
ncbi:MAG: pilus assembly PilX N-terminal domain-containing protein [Betaproteobacteria bacterium]|nr:pilus assembly PilX N-terminal domain-containing protein [Betaproteobacteria bacterium]